MNRLLTLTIFILLTPSFAMATEKTWTGTGADTNWFEDENWTPSVAPTSVDEVLINSEDAFATLSQTFNAKSITIGGNEASILTVDDFVSGQIQPTTTEDIAILNRRDGHLTMKGAAGTVVLKGQYKDSEESMSNQPSLVVWVG